MGTAPSEALKILGTDPVGPYPQNLKFIQGTEAGQLRLAFKNEPLSSNSRTLGSCGMEEGSEVVALPAQLTPEEAVRASISLIPSRGPDSRP